MAHFRYACRFTKTFSRTSTIHPGIFGGRTLWSISRFYLNTNANALIWLTDSATAHYGLVCSRKLKCFLVSPNFWKHNCKQMDNQIPEKTKRRAFTVSWIKKAGNFWKKKWLAPIHNCKCQIHNSVRAISVTFNTKTRNNQNRYLKQVSVRILLKQ